MIALRDYQQTAVANIFADWQSGKRSVLLMAATGTGKTIMFLAVVERILADNPTARILIIAHRRELIHQPIERLEQFLPNLALKAGIVMAARRDYASQIIVGTVQSLSSEGRIEGILQYGAITHVVIDECHHSTADTYRKVLAALGNPLLLGVTATPKRTDKLPLGDVYQAVSYKIGIQDAIKIGALVPFTPLGFQLPADAADIPENADGWQPEPMGDLLSAENILEIVLEKWKEFAGNRQTIGFTASVAQAHTSAAYFRQHGVKSEAVDGTTPSGERDRILEDFKAGRVQVVFNCMVLTEGFDAPNAASVMMIAPTKSDLIYVQRLGRGLRTNPGKADCVVLDFAPLHTRNIIMAGDVLDGVPRATKEAKEKAEAQGILFGFRVQGELISAVDPQEIQAQVLNYLSDHRLAWSFDGQLATAPLDDKSMLAVKLPDVDRLNKAEELRRAGKLDAKGERLAKWIGQYRVYRIEKIEDGQRYTWQAELVSAYPTLPEAQDAAEQYNADERLAGKAQEWRKRPATEKQLSYLKRLGCTPEPGLTCDTAARQITFALARRAVEKQETAEQKRILA